MGCTCTKMQTIGYAGGLKEGESSNHNQKSEVAMHAGVCSANWIHAANFSQERESPSTVSRQNGHATPMELSTRSWVSSIAPGRQNNEKQVCA